MRIIFSFSTKKYASLEIFFMKNFNLLKNMIKYKGKYKFGRVLWKINLDYSKLDKFITKEELEAMQSNLVKANEDLVSRSGKGNDFLGWLDLPVDYDKDEYLRIKKAADYIKKNAKVLVVIGIGGSYLGAKAVLENLNHTFYNELKDKNTPDIYFAGQNISGRYLKHLIEIIGDRDFCINVISKSGTTTEPAIAFRAFKNLIEKNMEKKRLRKEFLLQQIRLEEHWRLLQIKRAMKLL